MADLEVLVAGAGGRMGRAAIRAVAETAGLRLSAALARSGSPAVGKDAGTLSGVEPLGITVTNDVGTAVAAAEAIIDFTIPDASVALSEMAARRGLVHIIGTTGCSSDQHAAIAAAGRAGARIVMSGNFSLGVNLLVGLVRQAAAALPDFDIEILEMHHNRKVDAPSGTALMLGEAAAAGRGVDLETQAVRVRNGYTGPREAGSIGFATLRGGNVVGEHSVILAGGGERIELTHRADDRSLFATGAARAALWARDQEPGLYDMADVLGLKQ